MTFELSNETLAEYAASPYLVTFSCLEITSSCHPMNVATYPTGFASQEQYCTTPNRCFPEFGRTCPRTVAPPGAARCGVQLPPRSDGQLRPRQLQAYRAVDRRCP